MSRKTVTAAMLALLAALCIGAPAVALAEPGVAQESDYGERAAVDAGGMKVVTADMMPEGTYSIDLKTDSDMLKATDCRLSIQDGAMSATITLSGDGYEALYMGTGAEALSADAGAISTAEVVDGAYTYTVPVPALNEVLDLAALSRDKQLWYDHSVMFDASSLGIDVLPAKSFATDAPADFSSLGAATDLADGAYMMDVVLEGGSGRASVTSPAKVTVSGGHASADLVWSSEYYDYMVVNGYLFVQANTEGDSCFTIPVMAFDEPFPVVADTTRMEKPHEIEYTLTFDSASAVSAGDAGDVPAGVIIGVVAGVIVVVAVITFVVLRRRAKPSAPAGDAGAEEADGQD